MKNQVLQYDYIRRNKLNIELNFYLKCELDSVFEKYHNIIKYVTMNHFVESKELLNSSIYKFWKEYYVNTYNTNHWYRNYCNEPMKIYLYQSPSCNLKRYIDLLLKNTNEYIADNICLFRSDGSLLFGCVQHEELASLYLYPSEADYFNLSESYKLIQPTNFDEFLNLKNLR